MQPSILIVEDEPDTLKLFTVVFQRQRFDVAGAARATHGLDLIQQKAPDLVLMDLKLPGMSGADAIRFIRQSPDLQHVKVIAITAFPNLVRDAQNSGADLVFTKPVRPTVLLNAIAELM